MLENRVISFSLAWNLTKLMHKRSKEEKFVYELALTRWTKK